MSSLRALVRDDLKSGRQDAAVGLRLSQSSATVRSRRRETRIVQLLSRIGLIRSAGIAPFGAM